MCDGWTRSEAPLAAKRRIGVVCDSVLCGAGRRGAKLRACARGAKLRAMSEARLSAGASGEAASKEYIKLENIQNNLNKIKFSIKMSYPYHNIMLVKHNSPLLLAKIK